MAEKFPGVPYPITEDPRGYFRSQGGIQQIKSDLLILLLTNPGERCLTGDTKIPLADGTDIPIQELVGRESFTVYSYDKETDGVVPGKAKAYKTIENAELMEVVLDNDEKIRCTHNHLWLLRDGAYRRADELQPGDSLMPLYRKLNSYKYERIYQKNHKVVSVGKLDETADCYDLHVERFHNFALSAGVFVHNCMLPEFGTDLRGLIFEPNDETLRVVARDRIIRSIEKWEPRVSINSIEVSSSAGNSLSGDDDLTQEGHILFIRITFIDPNNIQQLEELQLTVPLQGL